MREGTEDGSGRERGVFGMSGWRLCEGERQRERRREGEKERGRGRRTDQNP